MKGPPPPEYPFDLPPLPDAPFPGFTGFILPENFFVILQLCGEPVPPFITDTVVAVSEDSPSVAAPYLIIPSDGLAPFVTTILMGLPANSGILTNMSLFGFSFDPNMDFEALELGDIATLTFTYQTVGAGGFLSNIATGTIMVIGVNDPPVAKDDTAMVFGGQSIVIYVLMNDADVDGGPLRVSNVHTPSQGGVTVPPDQHAINYHSVIPGIMVPGLSQSVVFSYSVGDGNGGFDMADVTVTVKDPFWYDDSMMNVPRSLSLFDTAIHGIKVVNIPPSLTAPATLCFAVSFSILNGFYSFELNSGNGLGVFDMIPVVAGTTIQFVIDDDADLSPFTVVNVILGTLGAETLIGTIALGELIVGLGSFDTLIGDTQTWLANGTDETFSDDAIVGEGKLVGDVYTVTAGQEASNVVHFFGWDLIKHTGGLLMPITVSPIADPSSVGDVFMLNWSVTTPYNMMLSAAVSNVTFFFGSDYLIGGNYLYGDTYQISLSVVSGNVMGGMVLPLGGLTTETTFDGGGFVFGPDLIESDVAVVYGDFTSLFYRFEAGAVEVGTIVSGNPEASLVRVLNHLPFGGADDIFLDIGGNVYGEGKELHLNLKAGAASVGLIAEPFSSAESKVDLVTSGFIFEDDIIIGGDNIYGDLYRFDSNFTASDVFVHPFAGFFSEASSLVTTDANTYFFGSDFIQAGAARGGMIYSGNYIGDVGMFSWILQAGSSNVDPMSQNSNTADSQVIAEDTDFIFGDDLIDGGGRLIGDSAMISWLLRADPTDPGSSFVSTRGSQFFFGEDILIAGGGNDVLTGDVDMIKLTDAELFFGDPTSVATFTMFGDKVLVEGVGFLTPTLDTLDGIFQGVLMFGVPGSLEYYNPTSGGPVFSFESDIFVFDLTHPAGIGNDIIKDFRTVEITNNILDVDKDFLAFNGIGDQNGDFSTDFMDLEIVSDVVDNGLGEVQILFNGILPGAIGNSIDLKGVAFGAGVGEFDSHMDLESAGLFDSIV